MKVGEILKVLESLAPLRRAEDFDNVGLLLGNTQQTVTGVLVCHDALEAVVDEAVAKNCNFIVAFHPIIFGGLKSITGKNYVERAVLKMIKNDITLYAIHTALDNDAAGVSAYLAKALDLQNCRFLVPKKEQLRQLTTYVPEAKVDQVKDALFMAGGGHISSYSECSFSSNGTGTFKPEAAATPVIGSVGTRSEVSEVRLELLFEAGQEAALLNALKEAHPYEEVAYQIYKLENESSNAGLGLIGELENELSEVDFLQLTKSVLKTPVLRHSAFINKKIKRVAVLGGSGSSAIHAAKRAKADAYITADLKYHDFFSAENQLLLVDGGHYETEQFTKYKIADFLKEKLPNFAIILANTNTNPVNYL
ncbi:Nif3-like dinuclear metal center hexameric protein [Flavobacterium sp.]|uniref:Nif3-like dinuclear metal center hexameric protein n=1 Tax=Flavobacterium sp. TaxID=239 RepID=UPI0026117306|nr:Nif3-like dinuclear metal center hexameric protein [Flavobacterium sp.]